MRRAPLLTALLLSSLALWPAAADEAPEARIFGLLMEDMSYTARQDRLAGIFRDLDREGRLTPALYRKILTHPSGRMFLPDLHDALARSSAERAGKIFGNLLTAPPDLPHQAQLEIRRASAYALSQVTESSEDERLFALLRQEPDLELRIFLAGAFAASQPAEVAGLAVGWSRDLDAPGPEDEAQAQSDPLWGQMQLTLRQALNRLLSRLGTETSLAELLRSLKLYVGDAPGWLVRDGLDLLGAGNYGPAYPVMRRVALDIEEELVTRTAALKAMARLYPPGKRQDLAEVARQVLAAAEGELEQPEVEAVIEALDER